LSESIVQGVSVGHVPVKVLIPPEIWTPRPMHGWFPALIRICTTSETGYVAVHPFCMAQACVLPLASINPAGDAGDTSPNILVWGTSTGISSQYYYVLSDIADQNWLPRPFPPNHRRGWDVGRGVPLLHPPHSVVRPPNLELALTPLYSPTHRLHYMHVKTYIAMSRTLRSMLYVRMYASATSQIRLIYLCAAAVRLYD